MELNKRSLLSTIYNSMKTKIIFVVLAVVVAAIGIWVYSKLNPPPVTIPQELVKENEEKKLNEYLPGWLPGTYEIDKDSFSRQEGQVFVFSATDSERNRLFFSQQPIPKDFDFDRFYKTQVIDPVLLENVPHESVYARSIVGKTIILSIKTEDTWIMMTTTAPIDQVMAQKIAQEIHRY